MTLVLRESDCEIKRAIPKIASFVSSFQSNHHMSHRCYNSMWEPRWKNSENVELCKRSVSKCTIDTNLEFSKVRPTRSIYDGDKIDRRAVRGHWLEIRETNINIHRKINIRHRHCERAVCASFLYAIHPPTLLLYHTKIILKSIVISIVPTLSQTHHYLESVMCTVAGTLKLMFQEKVWFLHF